MISVLLFWTFLYQLTFAETKDALLKQIRVEQNKEQTQIHFDLSSAADIVSLEARFIRKTMEWDIPNLVIKKDKMFTNVKSADISNVYVTQANPKGVRVRVNFENDKMSSNYHERVSFSKSKNQLTLIIDSSVEVAAHNIKEMNRIYDVMNESQQLLQDHLASKSVIRPTEDEAAPVVSTERAEEDMALIDESKNEAEIPLVVKPEKSKAASSSALWRMLIGVFAACLMLVSVVLVGKKLNAKRMGAPFSHDSIKVISQKFLGPKRNLTLVRVSGEYLLLGVTDHNINLIKTLTVVDDEIPDLVPQDFKSTVKKVSERADELEEQVNDVEDSFSVSSLSDVRKIFKKRKYIDEIDDV